MTLPQLLPGSLSQHSKTGPTPSPHSIHAARPAHTASTPHARPTQRPRSTPGPHSMHLRGQGEGERLLQPAYGQSWLSSKQRGPAHQHSSQLQGDRLSGSGSKGACLAHADGLQAWSPGQSENWKDSKYMFFRLPCEPTFEFPES